MNDNLSVIQVDQIKQTSTNSNSTISNLNLNNYDNDNDDDNVPIFPIGSDHRQQISILEIVSFYLFIIFIDFRC